MGELIGFYDAAAQRGRTIAVPGMLLAFDSVLAGSEPTDVSDPADPADLVGHIHAACLSSLRSTLEGGSLGGRAPAEVLHAIRVLRTTGSARANDLAELATAIVERWSGSRLVLIATGDELGLSGIAAVFGGDAASLDPSLDGRSIVAVGTSVGDDINDGADALLTAYLGEDALHRTVARALGRYARTADVPALRRAIEADGPAAVATVLFAFSTGVMPRPISPAITPTLFDLGISVDLYGRPDRATSSAPIGFALDRACRAELRARLGMHAAASHVEPAAFGLERPRDNIHA